MLPHSVWYEVPHNLRSHNQFTQRTFLKSYLSRSSSSANWCVGFRCPTGTLVELLASFTLMKQVVNTGLHYLVLLDAQSPSREIVRLALKTTSTHLSTSLARENHVRIENQLLQVHNQMFMSPRLQLPLGWVWSSGRNLLSEDHISLVWWQS